MIALLSEYPHLTPEQKRKVTVLIVDDGDWTDEQVQTYISQHFQDSPTTTLYRPDDWTKP